jgi:type IV secretion system protein TrbG
MKNRTFLIKTSICLAGLFLCLSANASATSNGKYVPAINKTKPNVKKEVRYVPVPLPGQLMRLDKKARKVRLRHLSKNQHRKLVGIAAIKAANKKAERQPNSREYINSIMVFNYMPGALYQIYCAPLSVTDIQLQIGEGVISVAAGDTLRWQVSKTYSGVGAMKEEHLLVKPTEEDLKNSLVITTTKRTYHLMLHSTDKTYMASVEWRYPDDNSFVQRFDSGHTDKIKAIEQGLNLGDLDFDYKIYMVKGKQPTWLPTMIFNDGKKTYVQFPNNMQEAPTLFVGNARRARAANYRVRGDYYIIDKVVQQIQLRSGQQNQVIVQIIRHNGSGS